MKAKTIAATGDVCLRYYLDGDEDDIDRYTSDLESSKFLARKAHKSKSQTRDMLFRLAQPSSLTDLGRCIWLIADADTLKAVGYLTLIRDERSVELHFGLMKTHRGKGYAKQAIALAAQHLLDVSLCEEVISFTEVNHSAAKSVLKKSGFEVVGIKPEFYLAPLLSEKKRDVYWFRYCA